MCEILVNPEQHFFGGGESLGVEPEAFLFPTIEPVGIGEENLIVSSTWGSSMAGCEILTKEPLIMWPICGTWTKIQLTWEADNSFKLRQ